MAQFEETFQMSNSSVSADSLPKERYLFKPFFGSSHNWALSHLAGLPNTLNVLDVGPGTGVFGIELKSRGFQGQCAIEIDRRMYPELQQTYSEVAPDLSELRNKGFDLVLLLDVLEHMSNPELFLQNLTQYLNPGATLLVSVPNIAHWSVRFSLLFGFFEPKERGILDRTHLQWFTTSRIRRMLAGIPGMRIEEQSATIEPLEFILPKSITQNGVFQGLSKMRLALSKTLPGMFAYQHVVKLRYK